MSKPIIFAKATKADWLQKVEKDLKGAPLTSLHWTVEGMPFTPFYNSEDSSHRAPMHTGSSNSWSVGEIIPVQDVKTANHRSMQALQMGADSLQFTNVKDIDLHQLLANIQLEWIHTHLHTDDIAVVQQLAELVEQRGYDPTLVSCSMSFTEYSDALLAFTDRLPRCQFYTATPVASSAHQQVGELLLLGERLVHRLQVSGQSVEQCNNRLRFQLQCTDDYYLNIGKLRALKLCWQRVLQSYDTNCSAMPIIESHIRHEPTDMDDNHNTIRSTSQALSAVIAGANTIYVHPSEQRKSDPQTLRINRNISHLLSQESHLGLVGDPAAGSYFFEHLTDELAKKSWSIFQDKFDPQQ